MELKEFTKKTILDLLTAIDEVNEELGIKNETEIKHKVRIDSNLSNKGRCIEFNVAVTAETNKLPQKSCQKNFTTLTSTIISLHL